MYNSSRWTANRKKIIKDTGFVKESRRLRQSTKVDPPKRCGSWGPNAPNSTAGEKKPAADHGLCKVTSSLAEIILWELSKATFAQKRIISKGVWVVNCDVWWGTLKRGVLCLLRTILSHLCMYIFWGYHNFRKRGYALGNAEPFEVKYPKMDILCVFPIQCLPKGYQLEIIDLLLIWIQKQRSVVRVLHNRHRPASNRTIPAATLTYKVQ